jgi:trehalose synthase-fused probable maltokinase
MTLLLPEEELVEYVRGQRWFGAKTEELTGAQPVDHAVLRNEPRLVDALVELRYAPGTHDVYQLLLGPDRTDVSGEASTGVELVRLVQSGETVLAEDGQIVFEPFGAMPQGLRLETSRLLSAEQTNSSLVVDDALFVKVFRRIEPGENPELEVLRFLALHGFTNAPALHGWWSYAGALLGGTLGIVQSFVPGTVDGWTLALDEVADRPEDFVARVGRLGEVIGELHATLASDANDPAFAPEEVTAESFALLAARMDDDIASVFHHLPEGDDAVAPLAGHGEAVRDLLQSLTAISSLARRIRNHGDLHLGQVLWTGSDWLVIDFEGEPTRSLPQRRTKRSPLRDVAGMLRSFVYAAAVTGAPREVEERARSGFLDAYTRVVQPTGLLPSPEVTERLLRLFELEKAVYELAYELAHRPEWVPIPVAGILRLLEEGL